MSTTDDTVYDAVYGDDEAAYAAAMIDPTRADVVRYYGLGPVDNRIAGLVSGTIGKRAHDIIGAGNAAGLTTNGPAYVRSFVGYVSDLRNAARLGDWRGVDYWTAHAAYVLARETGADWRPTTAQRAAVAAVVGL